jgi:hypothetical protein
MMLGAKNLLAVVALALALAVIFSSGRYYARLLPEKVDLGEISFALEHEAQLLNETLPEMVSENIRLDKATTGPGNALTYFYTITDDAESKAISKDSRRTDRLRAQLLERVCTMMPEYRERGTVVGYTLRNNAGSTIAEISINPRYCQ